MDEMAAAADTLLSRARGLVRAVAAFQEAAAARPVAQPPPCPVAAYLVSAPA
ncbi:hypothetical protein GCM10028796_35570 [Ramlibacter monticola]|uniref:Uncharacterized protein n=1 Tax=Ramlibacter monticola TaxID=1926872 RepID=A0A937CWF7_9BURK|nr:hypothetical protein [Ramlibacter monticola]MBL0394444.1 hypothetical protein [Ramlibacter monticola]